MKQLLPFKVGHEIYALTLGEIQEIVDNQSIYDFPGSPAVVAGAIGFHGRIVPVVDLAVLLKFPAGKLCDRLIVLVNERGPVALGVDQVLPIITLEETRMTQMRNYAERPYIADIVNWNGTMISLFDLDQLQAELDSRCINS